MQGNCTKFLFNLIIMLAFIGAGISPACKFISGEMIEICGPNGIEMVRLNANDLPPDAPQEHDTAKTDQCAFCFTGSQIKVMEVASVVVQAPDLSYVSSERMVSAERVYRAYRSATLPRGPPSFV